ncbi:hypothetical protein L2735_10465 [Shewanella olleyana]|uniref:DUF7225 domain-containing protein n=1 Tax=Shewanella olleyana TaxID=135626 RepID=UPI00200D3482|nr:hypothetical protein [Shewanella olleyana]MCL1067230.1 hypothetical protein [Shewanella olleyana]
MTVFEKVELVLSQQNTTIFTTKKIKELCSEEYGLNPTSIIPTDYCYNRINNGIGNNKNILIYMGFGEFKFVGKSFKYQGWVYQRPRGKNEDLIVGKWNNGEYLALTSPIAAPMPEHELRDAWKLNQKHIDKLYQDYIELLEVEINLLGCKPTELRHLIGRIGEFKCALLTNGHLSSVPNQHGFDVIAENGKKISVKTTAQKTGFVSINPKTANLVDELMLIQFLNNQFSVIYHGPVSEAIEIAKEYGGKYELDILKASQLTSA